jgi:transcriptional regulator with XRE-family HTH domain
MSKRSNVKRITSESRALRFLREQSRLSLRKAAALSGLGDGVIARLEQRRISVHQHHLDKLLTVYGATPQTFAMFVTGSVQLPQNLRFDCLELLRAMSLEQLRTIHPVLVSVAAQK